MERRNMERKTSVIEGRNLQPYGSAELPAGTTVSLECGVPGAGVLSRSS